MKERMSRSHTSRISYKVDDMLKEKLKKQNSNEKFNTQFLGEFMTIMFMGFYDKSLDESINGSVQVETMVLKLSHKKRKISSSTLIQATVGTSSVAINPSDKNHNKMPVVSVPAESFKPLGGSMNRSSHILLLHVETYDDNLINSDSNEPSAKRVNSSKVYGAELVIFDKQNRCLLTNGEYALALEEIIQTPTNMSPKKLANWETIPDVALDDNSFKPFDTFDKCPTLKFRLVWTKEAGPEYIENPIILTSIKTEQDDNLSNKENHLDSSQSNNNNKVAINGHSKEIIDGNGEERLRIVYQFIYNSNSRQQTEAFADFHCPWCSINCIDLYPLLKHLKLCHSRFNFIWTQIPNGARIDVSINEVYDGSYTGSPHDLIGQSGFGFTHSIPVRRTVVTNLLVCRPKRPKPQLSEFSEIDEPEIQNPRPFITGHNR